LEAQLPFPKHSAYQVNTITVPANTFAQSLKKSKEHLISIQPAPPRHKYRYLIKIAPSLPPKAKKLDTRDKLEDTSVFSIVRIDNPFSFIDYRRLAIPVRVGL
jgi:hypothetical protein